MIDFQRLRKLQVSMSELESNYYEAMTMIRAIKEDMERQSNVFKGIARLPLKEKSLVHTLW